MEAWFAYELDPTGGGRVNNISGVYLLRVQAGDATQVRKLTMIK